MKSSQTMKPTHMLLCMVLLVVGVVLFATGAAGLAFLPLVLCGLMIGDDAVGPRWPRRLLKSPT